MACSNSGYPCKLQHQHGPEQCGLDYPHPQDYERSDPHCYCQAVRSQYSDRGYNASMPEIQNRRAKHRKQTLELHNELNKTLEIGLHRASPYYHEQMLREIATFLYELTSGPREEEFMHMLTNGESEAKHKQEMVQRMQASYDRMNNIPDGGHIENSMHELKYVEQQAALMRKKMGLPQLQLQYTCNPAPATVQRAFAGGQQPNMGRPHQSQVPFPQGQVNLGHQQPQQNAYPPVAGAKRGTAILIEDDDDVSQMVDGQQTTSKRPRMSPQQPMPPPPPMRKPVSQNMKSADFEEHQLRKQAAATNGGHNATTPSTMGAVSGSNHLAIPMPDGMGVPQQGQHSAPMQQIRPALSPQIMQNGMNGSQGRAGSSQRGSAPATPSQQMPNNGAPRGLTRADQARLQQERANGYPGMIAMGITPAGQQANMPPQQDPRSQKLQSGQMTPHVFASPMANAPRGQSSAMMTPNGTMMGNQMHPAMMQNPNQWRQQGNAMLGQQNQMMGARPGSANRQAGFSVHRDAPQQNVQLPRGYNNNGQSIDMSYFMAQNGMNPHPHWQQFHQSGHRQSNPTSMPGTPGHTRAHPVLSPEQLQALKDKTNTHGQHAGQMAQQKPAAGNMPAPNANRRMLKTAEEMERMNAQLGLTPAMPAAAGVPRTPAMSSRHATPGPGPMTAMNATSPANPSPTPSKVDPNLEDWIQPKMVQSSPQSVQAPRAEPTMGPRHGTPAPGHIQAGNGTPSATRATPSPSVQMARVNAAQASASRPGSSSSPGATIAAQASNSQAQASAASNPQSSTQSPAANAMASNPASSTPQPNGPQNRYNLWIRYKDGKILALRNFYVKTMGEDTIIDMRTWNALPKNQFLWKFNMSLKMSGIHPNGPAVDVVDSPEGVASTPSTGSNGPCPVASGSTAGNTPAADGATPTPRTAPNAGSPPEIAPAAEPEELTDNEVPEEAKDFAAGFGYR